MTPAAIRLGAAQPRVHTDHSPMQGYLPAVRYATCAHTHACRLVVRPRLDHQRAGHKLHHHFPGARGGGDPGQPEGVRRARLRLLQCAAAFGKTSSRISAPVLSANYRNEHTVPLRQHCMTTRPALAHSALTALMTRLRSRRSLPDALHTCLRQLICFQPDDLYSCRRHQDPAVRGVAGRRQDVALRQHPALCATQCGRQALGLGALQPQRARG